MSEQYSKAIQEVLRRKRIFIRRKGLKRIPLCTIIRMLQHQESQTGKVDIEIFQRHPIADALGGGFDWKKTPEGFAYWHDRIVLKKRNITKT